MGQDRYGVGTIAGVLTIAGLAAATTAQAQTRSDTTGGLEEVVVTAQRRSEKIQETPLSISALTAQTIQNAGIGRLEDFSNALPNVYVSPRELRTTAISIRGISSDLNNPGLDQSAGVYVDGVYMGRAATINSNLFDLERIEVLRGPQGTLYGRNTIAGAVNIVTRKPSDAVLVGADVSLGDYDTIRANAIASGPLIPGQLAASIGASVDRRSGLVRNTLTGTKLDDINSYAVRTAFALQPVNGDWDLTIRADGARDRTNSGAFDVFNNGSLTGTPFADASPWDRTVRQDRDTVQKRDIWGVSGELNWRVGGGILTAITAYRGYHWYNLQDNDYSPLNMLSTGIRENQNQFSQEIRYASDPAQRFSYVAGAYYFHQGLKTNSLVIIGPALGIYPTEQTAVINAGVSTDSYAAFGRASYKLNEQFSLSAGLRVTTEDKGLDFSQNGDPFQVLAPNIAPRSVSRSETNVSPSATLEWRPAEKMLGYATFSEGYKSGGFNVFSVTPTDNAEYKPEHVNNYEVGFKSSFLDNRVRLNAAAFYMDYSDLQANQLVFMNGISRFQTSNAAKAHSTGVELDLAALLTPELVVNAAYGYTDASFDSYPNATAARADYTGKRLSLAPRHTASFAAEWTKPVSNKIDFFLRGEVTYRSAIYFAADNLLGDPELTLLNARIGLHSADGPWRVDFWVRNLTDERYVLNRFTGAVVPGQVAQALGAPRIFGLELRYEFR